MSSLEILLWGWAILSLSMLALWAQQIFTRDASYVDVGWCMGIGLMGLFFALMSEGYAVRHWLIAGLVFAWSARLGIFLLIRLHGEAEDSRYAALREKWGPRAQPLFFLFFQMQAAAAVLLTIPLLVLMNEGAPRGLGWWDFLGAAIILISIGGEWLADRQLSAWRANPANKGKTCRSGLWRFSRHPNYFFEWLHWMAYPIFGIRFLDTGEGLLWLWCWLSPLVMYIFITRITGIPPAERSSLKSRGEDYRRYQRETSAFFPWFPRKPADQS